MGQHALKIKKLYPNAIFFPDSPVDVEVEADDQGNITIPVWNTAKLGAKPTTASLDSQVTDQDALDTEVVAEKDRKFDRNDIIKAMGLTVKYFINETRAGNTTAITNAELKAKFKSYL